MNSFTKGRYSPLGIGRATALVSRTHQDRSFGGHTYTLTHVHRNIQVHTSTQVRTEIPRVQAQISTQIGQKYKGFPHEHNIQVVLVSRRGWGRASFSIVGGTVLRSLISIDLFPSDLSGSEVGAIFLDLALATHTQEVLMRSIWPFRVITIEDVVLTRRGEADSIYMRQFFYRLACLFWPRYNGSSLT